MPGFLAPNGIVALPYGARVGLDAGDGVLFQFNEPVRQVDVSTKAAVDALLTVSPPDWAEDYVGIWTGSSTLFIQAVRCV